MRIDTRLEGFQKVWLLSRYNSKPLLTSGHTFAVRDCVMAYLLLRRYSKCSFAVGV
jgi:hypothetical protein